MEPQDERRMRFYSKEAINKRLKVYVGKRKWSFPNLFGFQDLQEDEFPQYWCYCCGAISIGRRFDGSFGRVGKNWCKNLLVLGQYQHDVDQKLLNNRSIE